MPIAARRRSNLDSAGVGGDGQGSLSQTFDDSQLVTGDGGDYHGSFKGGDIASGNQASGTGGKGGDVVNHQTHTVNIYNDNSMLSASLLCMVMLLIYEIWRVRRKQGKRMGSERQIMSGTRKWDEHTTPSDTRAGESQLLHYPGDGQQSRPALMPASPHSTGTSRLVTASGSDRQRHHHIYRSTESQSY